MEGYDVRRILTLNTSAVESMTSLLSDYTERTLALEKKLKREKRKRKALTAKTHILANIILSSEVFDSASPSESDTGSPPPSPMEPSQDC